MKASSPRTAGQLGEDEIIRIFARESRPDAAVLIPNGDDAAAFSMGPNEAVVITTDTLVEGTHFRFDWSSARSVGRKLAAVNLSDLAAMGAKPKYGFLSVCLEASLPEVHVRELAAGLHERSDDAGLQLLGGNTTSIRGPNVFTLTLVGSAMPAKLISRGKSRCGDAIFVTGTLGDAKAGLLALAELGGEGAHREHAELVSRQNEPVARVEAGLRLASLGLVSAMADVSDGLGRDLRRLLSPANLGAIVQADRVPRSRALESFAAGRAESALELALSGGEDYELLFTAAPESEATLRGALDEVGVRLTRIGLVTDEAEFWVVDADLSRRRLPQGFTHFD